jgi:hypothetical protein
VRNYIKEKKWASKCYITIYFQCYDLKTTPLLKDSKGKKKNKSKETICPAQLDSDNKDDDDEDIDTSLDRGWPSATKNQLKAKRASDRHTNRVEALRQLIFAKHIFIKERCKN